MGEDLNFKPRANYILVTSNIAKVNVNVIVPEHYKPGLMEIQQVMAVGPMVPEAELKVGDWVVINMERFFVPVEYNSPVVAGVGGKREVRRELQLPFFAIPGNDYPFLKISDREIEGKIINYSKLPKKQKEYMSMKDFKDMVDKLGKKVAKTKINKKKTTPLTKV